MCRLLYSCDCRPATASGSTGVASVAGWLLRVAWRALELLAVALIAVAVWVAPRAWRVSVRATRAGWRRWQATRVPAATALAPLAIEAEHGITWSELRMKEAANR